MILVGVDAGGTSTRAVAVSESGRRIGSARGRAAALHERTAAEAAGEIARVASAATGGEAAEIVVAGVSGAADPEANVELLRALEASRPARSVHVLPDAVIALEGAFPGRAGIVVIAGTGSVAWGRNEAGEEARAGGWGYFLDRGGGVDVGRRVLRAVLRESDGDAPATTLTPAVLQALGVARVGDLARAVRSRRPIDLAALAPCALAAAAEGDAVARGIVTDAAEELARAARAVWSRLGFAAAQPVAGTGRLFSHPIMRDAFHAALRRLCPQAELRAPYMPPLGGALWKAFLLTGHGFPAVIPDVLAAIPPD